MMTTTQEALKMAIETLSWYDDRELVVETIQACKEALAEQPTQEPVLMLEALSDLEHQQWMKWAKSIIDSEPISEARKQRWLTMMVDYKDLPNNIQEYDREWARKVIALYTHPKQWQGLSDDELVKIYGHNEIVDWSIARAIEAKLREKNDG